MELYILRHAIAAPLGEVGNQDDARRPLTPEGREKMKKIARGMKNLGLKFDLIVSSPAARARQTAQIAARALKGKTEVQFSRHLAGGGNPVALLKEMGGKRSAPKSVLLVGHEPGLSVLISTLISGDEKSRIVMRKGGLAKLTTEGSAQKPRAALEWLLTPSQLRAIG
jgi:phosphohistidine phosphatase